MGAALSWLAALFAVLASALPRDLAAVLDGRSQLALALVPWLFLAGLPRCGRWSWGTTLGLALPTIALAAWVDRRGAFGDVDLLLRVAWAFACGVPAWLAAQRAARDGRYAATWFVAWVVVPLTALFTRVMEPSATSGTGAVRLALSPATRAHAVATDPGLHALDALAVVAALGLLALAVLGGARKAESPAVE